MGDSLVVHNRIFWARNKSPAVCGWHRSRAHRFPCRTGRLAKAGWGYCLSELWPVLYLTTERAGGSSRRRRDGGPGCCLWPPARWLPGAAQATMRRRRAGWRHARARLVSGPWPGQCAAVRRC